MALVKRRWSNVSLMQLATKISQRPAADPNNDKDKALSATKNITKDDFFPALLLDDDDDESLSSRMIIVPENTLKLSWDMLGFLIIVYQAIIIPYEIGFDVENDGGVLYADYLIHGFFVTDIILTFNTAYYFKGTLVTKRKMIAKNYMRVWFWIDVASTFPYEMIMNALPGGDSIYSESKSAAYKTPQMIRMLKMINFIRILRLLRLAKLKRLIYHIEDYISEEIIGSLFVFLRLTISGFFIAHWTACSWYMVSSIDSSERSDTWVKYRNVWISDGAERADAYVSSLYWAVTTMNTIGYGDIFAITINEKICAICAMVVSCGVFAYILGNISNVVNKKNELEAIHRKRVISLNSYMKQKDLPHDLRFRVRRYLDYIWEHQEKNKMEEDDILAMLSEPLRDEIYTHTRGPVFKSYSLFENFSPAFPALLSKELSPEVFAPGDGVFDEGEKTYKMYFMVSGTVDIYHKASSSSFKMLRKGSFFGEIGFFAKQPRTASVRCMEFVNMLSLARDGIEHILVRMPDAKETMRAIEERCKEHDYSVLKVTCYLCKAPGHIATMCNKMVLTRIKEEFRDKWLKSRKGTSVRVNPKFNHPNYERKEKRVVRNMRFSTENVIGMKREYQELYQADAHLSQKVAKYISDRLQIFPQQSIPRSRRQSMNIDKAVKKPRRFSIILHESPGNTEHDELVYDDMCRIPSFNLNLMNFAKSQTGSMEFDSLNSLPDWKQGKTLQRGSAILEGKKADEIQPLRAGTYSQI